MKNTVAEGRLWYMEEGIEIGKVGLPWLSKMQGTWIQSLSGGGTKIPHYFFGTTKKEKK